MSCKLKLIIFIVFFSSLLFSQIKDTISYPKSNIHIGASITKGTYIGTAFQVSDRLSFEVSYGGNSTLILMPFIGPDDPQVRVGVGINLHFINSFRIISNLSYIYKEQVYPAKFHSNIVSLNIGYLSLQKFGFHLFADGGVYYEYENKFGNNKNIIGANINLGIGFVFL